MGRILVIVDRDGEQGLATYHGGKTLAAAPGSGEAKERENEVRRDQVRTKERPNWRCLSQKVWASTALLLTTRTQ
jgi:hypothetical protein